MATQVEPVKFTGNAVDTGVATVMSGNAMEDMWDKSRGRPLRRSLALWLFSMKATWKIIRAHKNEAKQIKAQVVVPAYEGQSFLVKALDGSCLGDALLAGDQTVHVIR